MTADTNVKTINNPGEREIVQVRTIAAPRELVFEAWSKAEHLDAWWGPSGFNTVTESIDVRSGGHWRFVMHGPNGVAYPNYIRYIEVKPPELFVYDHGGEPDQDAHFKVTVTLIEKNGQTELTMRALFPSVEARDYVVREHNAIEGGQQTLGRLADYVATKLQSQQK